MHFEKYQWLRIVWLCLTFRHHITLVDYVAWRYLASASFMVVMVRYSSCNVLVKQTNLLTSILLGDDLFGRHGGEKKRAMWTPNWGLKSGPRFGAREKKKQFGGPQNGVQISHPILGPTLPIIFREVTPEKITFWIEFLWAGSLSWQPHVLALGRTLLRVLVFGTLFSPHFGVQRQSLFSKETMLKPCVG